MARTKQTARRENYGLIDTSNRQQKRRPRMSFFSRCSLARKLDYECQHCHGDMISYTRVRRGNKRFNGKVCPPCTRDFQLRDAKMRDELGSAGCVLVVPGNPNDPITRFAYGLGIGEYFEPMGDNWFPETLSHTADSRIDAVPRYECWVEPVDAGDQPNNRAERIAMSMGIFDLYADKPLNGTVVFTGPAFLPLTRVEAEQFEALAK